MTPSRPGELAVARVPLFIGTLTVVAGPRGIERVDLPWVMPSAEAGAGVDTGDAPGAPVLSPSVDEEANAHLAAAVEWLGAWNAGERTGAVEAGVVLDRGQRPSSTFRGRALDAIARLPFGEVVTYGELAELAGSPRAARAAGSACATNPWPVLLPCHRVVAADGIGGYAGRVEMKRAMLAREGVRL